MKSFAMKSERPTLYKINKENELPLSSFQKYIHSNREKFAKEPPFGTTP
jgi:hypothetical protein